MGEVMNNYERYLFLGTIIYLLAVFSAGAQTQTIINRPHHYISSDIDTNGRYQIIETPAAENNIFRFDRICGGTELLVLNDNQTGIWNAMQVPDLLPCINDGRSHYQLFASAQGDLVLLMNTDTKTTWRFDAPHMTWVHM